MENASKALIIAGAILLAILIVSLGIMVYQSAKDTVDDSNLNSEEVSTFNAKIESYLGSSVSASKVEALISLIQSVNAAETTSGSLRYIGIDISGANNTVTVSTDSSNFKTSKGKAQNVPTGSAVVSTTYTYTVTATYDASGEYNPTAGYIRLVTIKNNTTT